MNARLRRFGWLRAALASVLLWGLLVAVPLATPAAAQADAGAYTPCASDQDIDVLVMMDASGSLNAPATGLDKDGRQRTEALERFRAELASLLAELPAASPVSVNLALWRFESDVVQIADFAPASAGHPSDDQIRLSLGELRGGQLSYRTNHTDYLRALRAAGQAFRERGRPGACRLLLFFSDGLHDPTGRLAPAQIEELRAQVCGQIKPSFESSGIDTYAILLGFGSAVDDKPLESEMRTATMQALRALTGDSGSRLVRGLPYADDIDCERWSDEPGDRDGSVVEIAGLDNLALQLLEVVDVAASGLVEWTNCGIDAGTGTRSAPMPAGRYIDQIVAYPRNGGVTGYDIETADGRILTHSTDGSGPLRLGADDFGELDAGWTIEFDTTGDDGLGVACFVKHVSPEDVQSTGSVSTGRGDAVSPVMRSAQGADSEPLRLTVAGDAPAGLCEDAASVEWNDPRLRDWYCRDGQVVFDLAPLDCQESVDLAPLVGSFRPSHAAAVYGAETFEVDARVVIDGPAAVLHDCFGGPALECASESDGVVVAVVTPDTDELPRERLRAAADCLLHPPERGHVDLVASWQPDIGRADLAGELSWLFDDENHTGGASGEVLGDGTTLRLDADDAVGAVPLRFATSDELRNGDWRIAGHISLAPQWEPDDPDGRVAAEAAQWTRRMAHSVELDRSYSARSDSAAARWLTLLLIVASLLLSYLLLCLALACSMTLPDATRFWMYRADLDVVADGRGRLQFADGAGEQLASAGAAAVRGTKSRAGRGKRTVRWESDDLRVRLKRSFWLWLPGLIRGPWCELRASTTGALAARPRPRRSRRPKSSMASKLHLADARFRSLEAVSAPTGDPERGQRASVWAARPKSGRDAPPEQTQMRDLGALLNQAAEGTRETGSARPRNADGGDRNGRDGNGRGDAPMSEAPGEQRRPQPPSEPGDGARRGGVSGSDRPPPRGRGDRPPPRQR